MPKFANKSMTPLQRAPIMTTAAARTHQGGLGAVRDPKGELFILAVANLVSEDTFYESGKARDTRYAQLVRTVTQEDPEWVAALVPYLRKELNLRSVAVVTACEYVAAGGPFGRAVVNAACDRADEPGEVFAYWSSMYGRKLPKPIKRGIGDAATKLFNEYAVLRYDGTERAVRLGDLVDFVHPIPKAAWQADLFKHLIDRRHGHADEIPLGLTSLAADAHLRQMPTEARRDAIRRHADMGEEGDLLKRAGWSWEKLGGWLPGGMDAEAWEAILPNMGYMALLRNLRNLDRAGVSDETIKPVIDKLTDPDQIARSRQMPFRFYSAYREVESLRWAYPLEQALDLSLSNVPVLRGRTLIMLDLSYSMHDPLSAKSKRERYEIGAIFAVALAKRAENADLVGYANDSGHLDFNHPLLRMVDGIRSMVGGGTQTGLTLISNYTGQDRVVILTDGQSQDNVGAAMDRCVLPSAKSGSPKFYTFNIGGYRPTHAETGKCRYEFGSLNDAGFTLLSILESGKDGEWPHLASR